MTSRERKRRWLTTTTFAMTFVLGLGLAGGGDAAADRAKQRRRPSVAADADQEQAGEVIDGGGDEGGAAWVRSLEVQRRGAPVYARPEVVETALRGQLAPGARFPMLDRRTGTGCTRGPWYRVAEDAWVCADHVAVVQAEPSVTPYPVLADDEIVPFGYAFSGRAGTRTYGAPADSLEEDRFTGTLGTSWGLAIVASELFRGRPFVRTTRGSWIAQRELRFVSPSQFAGTMLALDQPRDRLAIAWVQRGGAQTFAAPDGRRNTGRVRGRVLVAVGEEVPFAGQTTAPDAQPTTMTRLSDGRFVETRALARPVRIAPPDGVDRGERWIDVDLERQTLVAYEGERPVFATLVSTGRRPGSTPVGLHRVWIKIAHATMDNVEDDDRAVTYSMDGVPWIQYFAGDVALHGVYWHDRFGMVKSHGCVNLSPRDARWLYAFTSPHVPDGWARVFPTERARGTPVHVHGAPIEVPAQRASWRAR